ncbi:MAG: exodeoxyribonuclease VII large subunit, partial [Spirochaetales bacterium]
SYQIICEHMQKAGEGDILALLEERKRKLAAEGLFAAERKKKLPPFPERVAVITSPTGAAIRDILRVLKRRNAGMHVVVLPAAVQGDEAAPALVRQLITANRYHLADVIILGRGGGSLEDLLPFSEEEVVRAVAESAIPVISAVGHEIDWALTDFAADVRAPTPSAAAEMVSADMEEVAGRVGYYKKQLIGVLLQRVDRVRLLLSRFTADQLERSFRILEQPLLQRLDDAKEGILYGLKGLAKDAGHQVSLLAQKITSGSPREILRKGYALVTRDDTGALVAAARQVTPPDLIRVRFLDGAVKASVEETSHEEL